VLVKRALLINFPGTKKARQTPSSPVMRTDRHETARHVLGDDRVVAVRLRMPWSRSTRLTLDTLISNRWATCELVAPERYRSIAA
jgi:hypothetical protein